MVLVGFGGEFEGVCDHSKDSEVGSLWDKLLSRFSGDFLSKRREIAVINKAVGVLKLQLKIHFQ